MMETSVKISKWLMLMFLATLWACVEQEGPFERVGEEIDEATEDIRTEGEAPLNQLDDVIDEARDAAEDVTEQAEESL
jgi:hypothetical protein